MSLVVTPASPPRVAYSFSSQIKRSDFRCETLEISTESEPQVALLPLTKKGDRLNVENRNQTVAMSVSIEYNTISPLTIANVGTRWRNEYVLQVCWQ